MAFAQFDEVINEGNESGPRFVNGALFFI